MAESILVFVSHSSEDKESYIEPIVSDLEQCYIDVWIDRKKIAPGENLRHSIFKNGLDKADIALLFFTENSLQSSWVDREIKHVLREEAKKGNDFDLSKIISIFDSEATYKAISERYPELTDDLLHLMPVDYEKIKLGQLVSAIWSKYFSLQGGDIETQKMLLSKDKEIFQRDKDIQGLKLKLQSEKSKDKNASINDEFEKIYSMGDLSNFIKARDRIFAEAMLNPSDVPEHATVMALGLIDFHPKNANYSTISAKGREFFKWILLHKSEAT